jgi:hypothetical protein
LGDDKLAIAKSIVGASVMVRETEQSVNWGSIALGLIFVIALPAWWFHLVGAKIQKANDKQAAIATRMASGDTDRVGAYLVDGTLTVSMDGVFATAASDIISLTMTASAPTVTPTSLPTITPTAGLRGEPVQLKLSFYDPNIGKFFPNNPEVGKINCALWDVAALVCNSNMADGTPFYDAYGKAVACPPPMQNGDLLRVSYPEQLAGDWICQDRGWAIDRGYVDFLLRYPDMVWTGYDLNNFPWWSTVRAQWLHP